MTRTISPSLSSRSVRRDGIASTSSLLPRGPEPLRIAMLAPPWIAVPPTGYGGVETMVSALTEALVALGHDVTLFCAPGSASAARVVTLLDLAHPDEIERALYESDHVARAFAAIDAHEGLPAFDVVHDHCGFTALALADRLDVPVVHTLHGPFDAGTGAFYAGHGHKGALVAISAAQVASAPAGVTPAAVIRNPVDVAAWPLQVVKDDYLLWVGRMNDEKGPHRAIAAAREAGVPLVLAGIIQPGQEAFFAREVAPHLDGDRVRFVGEVGGATKRALFAGARGLLMPIRWDEPFGMVMIEAAACGTPVIAFDEGAAPEIVVDGVTGFLVPDEAAMAAAVHRLPELSPRDSRDWVVEHYDASVIAQAYAELYASVAVVRG
jgi:glycosyltransferase involved in cell wall biosynthesis